MGKEEKPKSDIKLSNEFKKGLRKKSETKWLAIIVLLLAVVVVFTALVVGTYEIFYKSEKAEQTTNNEDKIQSRPEETEKPSTTKTKPTQTIPKTTTPGYEVYTVAEGDTLSGIAAKYDTTSKALAQYNGFSDPEAVLHIGQKVKIPK